LNSKVKIEKALFQVSKHATHEQAKQRSTGFSWLSTVARFYNQAKLISCFKTNWSKKINLLLKNRMLSLETKTKSFAWNVFNILSNPFFWQCGVKEASLFLSETCPLTPQVEGRPLRPLWAASASQLPNQVKTFRSLLRSCHFEMK